ncbi:C-Maf-inducing protein [Trichoplax sp. H2]|nr:C-Maf-inducing protein [Trichoplax sp. H2]|eukprot:RDD47273.1 C-Maf-inducing protein [Trichoplax sp. H2]
MATFKPSGYMAGRILYEDIESVSAISSWDTRQRYCIRLWLGREAVLLQVPRLDLQQQWLISIKWRIAMKRFKFIINTCEDPVTIIKEVLNIVSIALKAPMEDSIYSEPIDAVSMLLMQRGNKLSHSMKEKLCLSISPLTERVAPTEVICQMFHQLCQRSPCPSYLIDAFEPSVVILLKKNLDYGKYPYYRSFLQDFIFALSCQESNDYSLQTFIESVHEISEICPHPRVLPNLACLSLAAIYKIFQTKAEEIDNASKERYLDTYITLLDLIFQYNDWLPHIVAILQPIPIPEKALHHDRFLSCLERLLRICVKDDRCEVHKAVLNVREGRRGWIHLFAPDNLACRDDGDLFAAMICKLISCCCRDKPSLRNFLEFITPMIAICKRGNLQMIKTVIFILERDVIPETDPRYEEIISSLQSTEASRHELEMMYERKAELSRMQQKGGYLHLTVPAKSTDKDLADILATGEYNNLKTLSLAFTHVTSACAEQLIKLRRLTHLNLWSTQFGDKGLKILCENLDNLESLNLCETPATDKGIEALTSMKSLKILNLNSTKLTTLGFENLMAKLPNLEYIDVRYTEAWVIDVNLDDYRPVYISQKWTGDLNV